MRAEDDRVNGGVAEDKKRAPARGAARLTTALLELRGLDNERSSLDDLRSLDDLGSLDELRLPDEPCSLNEACSFSGQPHKEGVRLSQGKWMGGKRGEKKETATLVSVVVSFRRQRVFFGRSVHRVLDK